MTALLKDGQARAAVLLLTLAFAVLTALGCLFVYQNGVRATHALLQQDVALAGGMARGDPTSKLSIITGTIDGQDLAAGTRLLAPYGYGENTPPEAAPYYTDLTEHQITLFCICAAMLYLTALILLLVFFTRSDCRLRKFAKCVEAGDFLMEGKLVQGDSGFDVLRSAVASLAEGTGFRADALQKDKEYLRDLLADISHQMKTPLSALRMYHELLAKPDLSPEKRNEFLLRSQKQVERTDWLVQSLLKMARLESGSVSMNYRRSYLLDTVELSAAPFKEAAKQKNVDITTRVPAEICFAHDADWVAEAIGNLIKNALEHTLSGGHILVEADETPLSVELRVKDDGDGMTNEEIPHAFERFYRTGNSKESNGVGIGLSLSKEIIEKNGGEIFVQSSPGTGSVFTMTFLKGWRPPENPNLKKS